MNQPQWWKKLVFDLFASVIFYSSIPLPYINGLDFRRVAYFAPLVGLMIGGILGLCDLSMNYLGIPVLTRSALVVSLWMAITGGLHLDGVMDTADGLAVGNPEKRLEVMTDSATGAFGAMAAIALILLKTTALIEISDHRWLVLMAACGWGRWGQQLAIACYPYLKPTGKGAFHKAAIRSFKDLLPSFFLLLGLSVVIWLINPQKLVLSLGMVLAGSAISVITAAWFNYKLGGHTGDTYGAVVEWTEALFLCVISTISA
ncbi:adenosylcobinamide-GDP ribazoletransferase [Nodularia spumigena]|uniref:adenosylcobinamide-GDP ribazoletransferase n=1 Tax=Nodularia spumigena TaxID=70799 RepID=UPI00232BCD66|nr:adenosylcobinamide-GDP ribazoletransferase [Nodularia spumigena]MDB9319834.1 adenosylcobinamide-GDP ribazoletransferase [Nodularia spumigena CS-590/01A]MDB9325994.1 adenosylcobinamide-GDP ribazoletransferase [Nodularia spumigena CS-590/02]MDB9329902.1 adenosylcobinamide-GDP ribazoletransferase [Nodularia spumigena CS-591/04]MDB9334726.1 adenosylcobinamide-GDP ribazoletransferase [Nodularia spumigena CS-590/01]MDB9344038.1 adenosylcobinamide-GDP ribazoletransferase [Nodularia spumigena CS-58